MLPDELVDPPVALGDKLAPLFVVARLLFGRFEQQNSMIVHPRAFVWRGRIGRVDSDHHGHLFVLVNTNQEINPIALKYR
jgi:hypothetical protein